MDEKIECPYCKWTGTRKDLRLTGCMTTADTWWQCPTCGVEARHMVPVAAEAVRP